jgi:Carboxypeptidase regulatory-like domain
MITLLIALILQTPVMKRAPFTASITGSVVRAGTGEPVSRARILLTRVEGKLSDSITAIAGDDGKFTIRNIPPGAYRVFSDKVDYVRAEYGQRAMRRSGTPVTLNAGQQVSDIALSMVPAGVITGRVLDPYNEPIAKVFVRALKPTYSQGERMLDLVQQTQSNDLGEYRFFDLTPGLYFISATPYFASRIERNQYLTPTPPRLGAFGEGTAGRGVTNILNVGGFMDPMALNGETYIPTYYPHTTDPNLAVPIEVKPDAAVDGINIGTTRVRSLSVRGLVIDAATGQPPSERTACSGGPSRPQSLLTTGADGGFEISGVVPGVYQIRCTTRSLMGVTSVDVRDADVDNVRVLVHPRFNVTGRITLEGNDQSAVPDYSKMQVMVAGIRTPFVVQPDGAFNVSNLGVGDYQFSLKGMPDGLYLKSARIGETDILAGATHLEATPRNVLEMIVSPNAATVEAVITDVDGRPVQDARAVLIPDAPLRQRFDLYQSAMTDAAGLVRFEGVSPGEYKVFAWQDIDENAWQNVEVLRVFEDRATAVELVGTSRVTVRVRVLQ